MTTIWKFPINVMDRFSIRMPKPYKVLSVQVQHGQPHIWVLLDNDEPLRDVPFRVYGTGGVANNAEQCEFIGTFQELNGELVWHLFKE